MSRLMEMVQDAGTIAILGHIRPDGDCVGSCLAMCNYLLEQYPDKTVQVYLEKPADKYQALLAYLRRKEEQMPGAGGIVYCLTRKKVEEICYQLREEGFSVTRYHAGLSDEELEAEKEKLLKMLKENGIERKD